MAIKIEPIIQLHCSLWQMKDNFMPFGRKLIIIRMAATASAVGANAMSPILHHFFKHIAVNFDKDSLDISF